MLALYVSKADPQGGYQTFPEPVDLENWYVVELETEPDLSAVKFDTETEAFIPFSDSELTEQAIEHINIDRQSAYRQEADPLYNQWQYLLSIGDVSAPNKQAEWLAKRADIELRYPLPGDPVNE